MTRFIRWLLGVDASLDWAAGEQWHVEFHSLPQGPWAAACALLALGAVAGVWWLYRKEGRELRPGARMVLAALRLFVLASVAFMLLEMVVVLTRREYVPSHLLVLLDTSESMALQDPYTDEQAGRAIAERLELATDEGSPDLDALRGHTRLELARRALERMRGELAEGRELADYAFATGVQPIENLEIAAELKPTGPGTAVGDAVKNALAQHRGQPLAGVLLVTDGQSNAGDDPVKVAEQAGKEGVPIVALAVGTAEGPRNVALADLEASPVVFVRDPIEIGVLIDSRGLKGATATVVLEERREDGPWNEIGREVVVLGEDAAIHRVAFRFTPDSIGQIDFRAQVLDVGPELTTADNTATKSVRVIRQKIRVLLIAGGSSPEVQFLRNALLRDTALEFASWLQSAGEGYEHVGHRPIRRLPNNQEELDRFDVLILFDPDMRKLGPAWPEMLTKFVGNAGGGLIFVAGEQYSQQLFSPAAAADDAAAAGLDNSWLKILPVVRDPGLYQSAAEVRLSSRDTYTFEVTPEGMEDPIFQFVPERGRNREVLANLPGMYWHFPVTRAKPAATVLARHGDPRMTNSFGRHVLMATQLYGPGRSVFIGFDSTYRWRYLSEDYFDGFWARLVDRVGRSKLLGGRYPFTLAADKTSYRMGERVTLTARFISSADLSASLSGLGGEIEVAGQAAQPIQLEPVAHEPGTFQATFLATEPGAAMVRILPSVETELESGGPRAATLSFRVEPARQEVDNPTVNRAALEAIARASGGQAFALADVDKLPAAFKVRQVERVLEFRDEVWDAPFVFGSVLLLLTVEWVLRKRYRMA
jgi:hypothetical protein